MHFKVQFLRDPHDPASACWMLYSFPPDLESAVLLGRDGFPEAARVFNAKAFRILDKDGDVLCQECADGEKGALAREPALPQGVVVGEGGEGIVKLRPASARG